MAFVFPMFIFSVVVIRSVILFKRGAIKDKEVQSSCSAAAYACAQALSPRAGSAPRAIAEDGF